MATATAEPEVKPVAAKKPEAPEAPPKPAMPFVEKGMVVLWHRDGERAPDPWPAIVRSVYPLTGMVDLALSPGGYADGVKHVDAKHRVDDDAAEGAWEHCPWMQMVILQNELDWQLVNNVWQ